MNLQTIKNEEKRMNLIMFLIWGFLIPIAACAFVLLFLDGTIADTSVLTMVVSALIIKLFENKLGGKAKFLYASIMPVCGAITMVVGNDGKFGAMTQAYFLATVMVIAYYNLSVIKVNAIVTIVVNLAAMLIFPGAYLKLHNLTVWVFILIVYLLLAITSYLIADRTCKLFKDNEKKEIEIETILNKVKNVSEGLYSAGNMLSSISENESASAQQLAATSEHLMKNSNLLSSKTDESIANLDELKEWENVVADNVHKVENISKELLNKSTENTTLLNDLHTVNDEVSNSMKITMDVAEKLSSAVNEIGVTLNLINDISSSTNLLALNASIEAARAGEAGRGFAVVATEVGNLANSTKESLVEVENVIKRVQNNVREITLHVEENAQKLTSQNDYFDKVFTSMRDMTNLLNESVNQITLMGDAHNKQSEVIKNTVSINYDIVESIKNENEQFFTINQMAESNASDISQVTAQAGEINDMVDEINKILK